MVEQGAAAEVKALLARKLEPDLPIMRAIGVAEIAACLSGETSLAQAIAAGQQATRRYAKRQYTWFAHQPPAEWPRSRELRAADAPELVEGLSFVQTPWKGSSSTGSGQTD
jgi:tRNA dimethylallyltransferase